MRVKKIVIKIICICICLAISLFIGFVIGYFVEGMTYTNETVVRHYTGILHYESGAIISLPTDCSIVEIIDTIERLGSIKASFIKNNENYTSEENREKINEALTAWQEAREKLELIKSSKKN